MLKFIIKRLLWMIPVLLGVTFIVFAINRMSPGDPVQVVLGGSYTQEQYDAKEAELGLDKPFLVQFFDYIKNIILEGDLGSSYSNKRSVSKQIMERLPITLKFAVIGCLITVVLGIPFGIISATKQYSLADYSVTVFSLIFASMPTFWMGLMFIIIFALRLKWLPASMPSSAEIPLQYWILPALTVGLSPVATITRLTRSSMLDVVRQDYIRTARAKGLPEGTIIKKHALKNGLIPVVTVVGINLGMLVAGSVVVENIFSIPGIGMLITNAIAKQDYPIIQGCVLILAVLVCIINLLTDLVYGFIDPRIMAQYKAGGSKKIRRKMQEQTEEAAG